MLKIVHIFVFILKIVSILSSSLQLSYYSFFCKNLVASGVLISPGKLLDVPIYIKPAAVYKRARSIAFNPMNLTKVHFGNFRKRSLNDAIQERVSPNSDRTPTTSIRADYHP